MKYLLIVKRLETNEQYQEELEQWERSIRYMRPEIEMRPQSEKEVLALETIVGEEEFIAVKKAILEVLK